MSGLVLSLKAEEKFLVNGALLINGSKRSQIRIGGDDVNVLRLSDAMHPREITTPVRRVYYAAQIYLSGDANPEDITCDILDGLRALETVFENTPLLEQIQKAKKAVIAGRFYSLICSLRPLLVLEAELLNVELPSICKDEKEDILLPKRRSALQSKAAAFEATPPPMPSKSTPVQGAARGRPGRPVLSLMEKTG